jgi:hypothetical protein
MDTTINNDGRPEDHVSERFAGSFKMMEVRRPTRMQRVSSLKFSLLQTVNALLETRLRRLAVPPSPNSAPEASPPAEQTALSNLGAS